MNTRTLPTLILAILLILLVMGVAAAFTFTGAVEAQKYSQESVWTYPFPIADSMKMIDLTGDGQVDVFVQNQSGVTLLDAAGNPTLEQTFGSPLSTTLGDVDGDGVEDVIVFSNQQPHVAILSRGQAAISMDTTRLGAPARAALIRFASGAQLILGDTFGGLEALSTSGESLWFMQLSSGDAIRGLDDALVAGETFLAAANHDGTVALLDSQGQPRWSYALTSALRRLRAYDLNGDGNSEVLLGGENGQMIALDAASGAELLNLSLGQPVTEIREAEVDGDPGQREFVAGGKDGGVWAFRLDGKQLWKASVGDKVTEIAGLDVNEDGAEEVVIGDESGGLYLFAGKSGDRYSLGSRDSGITRIDAGKLSGSDQILVADGSVVQLSNLKHSSLPPLKAAPLVVGLLISAVIAGAAWFIATLPSKPAIRLALEDQSPESLLSQRRMLKESIADVERLKQSGEMTADAYLARLKELRSQLADNEAAMKKAGVSFVPETFKCPNCGGTLPLGLDKCDYCGQVVIT